MPTQGVGRVEVGKRKKVYASLPFCAETDSVTTNKISINSLFLIFSCKKSFKDTLIRKNVFYFTPANLRNTDFTLTETGKMPKGYIIALILFDI